MNIIEREFYNRSTLIVAKELLGNILCRKTDNKILKGKIVETEAYTQEDPACHAFRGRTKRAKTLFEKAGTSYVYFIYGMYYCMNAVTEPEGRGCAVLIRALEPLENIDNTNGPAKLCNSLKITCELNGIDLTNEKSPIWIEYGEKPAPENIIQTVRIGIKQASDYPWRFYLQDSKWVSKK